MTKDLPERETQMNRFSIFRIRSHIRHKVIHRIRDVIKQDCSFTILEFIRDFVFLLLDFELMISEKTDFTDSTVEENSVAEEKIVSQENSLYLLTMRKFPLTDSSLPNPMP